MNQHQLTRMTGVVFWFWLVIYAMCMPPILFGLVFAAGVFYLRLKWWGKFLLLLKVTDGTTKVSRGGRNFIWNHWSLILGTYEMKSQTDSRVGHRTDFLIRRPLFVRGVMCLGSFCVGLGLVGGINMLSWPLLFLVFGGLYLALCVSVTEKSSRYLKVLVQDKRYRAGWKRLQGSKSIVGFSSGMPLSSGGQ